MEFFRKKKPDPLNPFEVIRRMEEEVNLGHEERLTDVLKADDAARRERFASAAKRDEKELAELERQLSEAKERLSSERTRSEG